MMVAEDHLAEVVEVEDPLVVAEEDNFLLIIE
jgi:hypothetical protein